MAQKMLDLTMETTKSNQPYEPLTLEKMRAAYLAAMDSPPPEIEYEKYLLISKKQYKQLVKDTQTKKQDSRLSFALPSLMLMGVQVYIRPYLKKPRLIRVPRMKLSETKWWRDFDFT
jgi:hypothetical protein